MERIDALKLLAEKVEAGSAIPPDFYQCWNNYVGDCGEWAHCAFTGSLDAAKALNEAVLPGWTYQDHLRRGLRYTSYIGKGIEDEPLHAESDNPARAWLLAILRALISKEGE